jgi:hypothetical protein
LSWAGLENIYATSNDKSEASQQLVHRIFFPLLEKKGLVEYIGETFYRNTVQTIWKINAQEYMEDLCKYKRWT